MAGRAPRAGSREPHVGRIGVYGAATATDRVMFARTWRLLLLAHRECDGQLERSTGRCHGGERLHFGHGLERHGWHASGLHVEERLW